MSIETIGMIAVSAIAGFIGAFLVLHLIGALAYGVWESRDKL